MAPHRKTESKLNRLRDLDEETLRTEVYVPLLRRIPDISNVEDVHGSRETGIDVAFYQRDAFGLVQLNGAQLKAVDVNLSAKSRSNVQTLTTQAKVALAAKHRHAITKRRENLARLYIVTSGRISDQAKDFIVDACGNIAIMFIDGQELLNLLEKHMPEYFTFQDQLVRTYFLGVKPEITKVQVFGPGRLEEREIGDVYVSHLLVEGEEGPKGLPGERKRLTPQELIKAEGKVLVLGDQHTGKTTLLRHLFLTLLESYSSSDASTRLPILSTFQEVLSHGGLVDTAKAKLSVYAANRVADELPDLVRQGRLAFLIDGFSQLPDIESQRRGLAIIEELTAQYPGNLIIWTSREIGSLPDEQRSANRVFKILPLRPSQLYRLVDKLLQQTPAARDSILQSLEVNLAMSNLPRTPLVCSLIVSICSEQEGFIASNLAEIFERYLELLLGKWSLAGPPADRFGYLIRKEFLGHIASDLTGQSAHTIPIEAAIHAADAFFRHAGLDLDGADLIQDLVGTGVLTQSGDFLAFCLPTFQEFFAARRLSDVENGDDWILARFGQRQLSDTIVLYAGLKRDCTSLLGRILESTPRDIVDFERELDQRTDDLNWQQPVSAVEDETPTEGEDESRPPSIDETLEDLDMAWELGRHFAQEAEVAAKELSKAERTARELLFDDVGYRSMMVGLIAKNAVFTQQDMKELVVRRVVRNFAGLLAELTKETKYREEFTKFSMMVVLHAMMFACLGSPLMRKAYLAHLRADIPEAERFLLTNLLLNLALPGYIDEVEAYVAKARSALDLFLCAMELERVLDLRATSTDERTRLENVRKRIRRKLRTAREYLDAVFRPVLEKMQQSKQPS